MLITIVLLIFILVGVTDFRRTLCRGHVKEIVFYAVCMGVSFVLLILYCLQVPLQGPTEWVREAVKALSLP